MILVVGTNMDGNHAGGAARFANLNHGLEMGVAEGLSGTAYALPTVGHDFSPMPLEEVAGHVDTFLQCADYNEDLNFKVTRIGCGIAGFTDEEIAPLFVDAPTNCYFDEKWKEFLPDAKFWGTL
jgi:hypothetical protein